MQYIKIISFMLSAEYDIDLKSPNGPFACYDINHTEQSHAHEYV